MRISLVLQSYGSLTEYSRAIFSIWSFYAYCSIPKEETIVILFTDSPDYFEPYLKELPIRYIVLTPEKLKQMRGEIDFIHRVKIAAIGEAFEYTADKLLYTDSDSFFISDPVPFLSTLSEKNTYMHMNEYEFEEMKLFKLPAAETFHSFYDFVSSRVFKLTDGTSIRISPHQISWNAGVIILHHSHRRLLADVYALTESFYPATQNHGCEQYAFSIILERETNVSACTEMVHHYWVLTKKKIADKFLNSRITSAWVSLPLAKKIEVVKKWTRDLPIAFENDVLMLRTKAMHSFQENNFIDGYHLSCRALMKEPFYFQFWKDISYHVLRNLRLKK